MTRYQVLKTATCVVTFFTLCGNGPAATIEFGSESGSLQSAGLANNPDLVYNWSNGNVRIYADGASIAFINLHSAGMFTPPADFSDFVADTGFPTTSSDNTASAIGWISDSYLFGIGFDGPAGSINTPFADLGNIFPTGLDHSGLTNLLTLNQWTPPIGSGQGGSFDLVALPEPSSLVLAAIGLAACAVVMLQRGRRRRKVD